MFPSSGLLTQLNCYLFRRKLCKRPHCVFKHAEGAEEQDSETSDEPTLSLTETEDDATDECLQELERINREIESVKHQVEEEQRRLSYYQIKSRPATTSYCYKPDAIVKNVVQASYFSQSSPPEANAQPKKYTVDCSKPRTDLEYDPLSNFSSDLRCHCSTKRGHKSRDGHGSEREQFVINQRMTNVKFPQSQKQSLEHSESNEDDDVLIIDLTLSPTKTEEPKPLTHCIPNDIDSNLAITNANGLNEIMKQNLDSKNVVSSKCNSTSNNCISNNENIFVKMTKHLSSYNNINTTQSCDSPSTVLLDKNSSANALPVNETLTNQIQKAEAPASDAPRNVKEPQKLVYAGSLCEPQDSLSAAKWTQNTCQQSAVVNQEMHSKKADVTVLDFSSDELNYSDMEVSESDPDEECYRIFMEANGEEKSNEPTPEVISNVDAEQPDINLQPQALLGKRRAAHEAKVPELVSKARPQPKVLVPLRVPVSSTFPSQPPASLMIHQEEQRASMLTASIKAGQALTGGEFETKHAQTPAPCASYIPLGATVIDVGNNLHLILPEGTFPVTDTSGQVSSVLTPITPVNTYSITMKQAWHQSTATQQKRTAQPVMIPSQAWRPVSVAAATSASPCSTAQVSVVKPFGNKRKFKQKCETVKVPHDIRQSYVNKFTEEFLRTTPNINEAFEKALAEERTVYNRSANKLKYLSVAVNALKRLRNQSCGDLKDKPQSSQKTKGNIMLNPSLLNGEGVMLLYECLKDYALSDEMLIQNNFPFQNPEKSGSAILFTDKKSHSDPLRKLCCRCGATYSVSRTGKHTRKEECTYHYGRGVENKVPGGVETRYSCCEGIMGSPGCQVFKLHVCNSLSMDGFVTTTPRDSTDTNCPGVYSVDCEKCYTIDGLELSRVTVVNSSLQIVYDTFVRPNNEVIDYNTRFSGICEDDMKGHCPSLKEVQENLLSFISADTILIGHDLDTNLCVLKLLHGLVVDTSVVFPHRLGPPHKLSLHSLTAEYLRKIIQESACGHDTAEDAVACMELMLWKAKEDGKMKKAH